LCALPAPQVQAKASEARGDVDEAGVATALCHLWLEYLAASSASAPSAGMDAALAAYDALVRADYLCPLCALKVAVELFVELSRTDTFTFSVSLVQIPLPLAYLH
jgi:hypothetical protein